MNELIENALLYDFYGELLTSQQRKIYEEVYFNDYSASEVAKDEKISRQGVHDMLKRTNKALKDYEDKLGLVKKHLKMKEIASDIEKLAKDASSWDKDTSTKIINLSKEIQEI